MIFSVKAFLHIIQTLKQILRLRIISLPFAGNACAMLVIRDDIIQHFKEDCELWVNPNMIIGNLSSSDLSRSPVLFFQKGSWLDCGYKKIECSGKYCLFAQIMSGECIKYEQLPEFEKCLGQVRSSNGYKTNHSNSGIARTRHELCSYIENQLSLARHMKSSDYGTCPDDAIPVAVGPAGALFRMGDGKHRHIFAQIMQLPKIKVRIVNMHVDYLKNCSMGRHFFRSGLAMVGCALSNLKTKNVD